MKTKEQRIKGLRMVLEQQRLEIEAMKEDLAKKHGLERNRKFDLAWNIAWNYGHSNGLEDVRLCFEDLADLIKP